LQDEVIHFPQLQAIIRIFKDHVLFGMVFQWFFCLAKGRIYTIHKDSLQGSYGHGKPGKVMEFLNCYFQAWKSQGKNLNHKSLGKVMEICYNHIFIYGEFEIINTFF